MGSILSERCCCEGEVLRLTRPRDKQLAGTFQSPPAEQIRESEGSVSLALAGHQSECSQGRLRFLEAHVDFPAQAAMPAECGSWIALWRLVAEEKAELERFA
jgi:hypothetical protein